MSLPIDPIYEQWRTVPGFPDYEVSDHGRVKSHKHGRSKILKCTRVDAYLRVRMGGPDGRADRSVHSLVLEVFEGPRPEGMEIRHLNGDPLDCRLVNLRYGTKSENMLDRVEHGNHHFANKTHCPQGHPYAGGNLYVQPSNGGRYCRVCHRARQAAYMARKAAA